MRTLPLRVREDVLPMRRKLARSLPRITENRNRILCPGLPSHPGYEWRKHNDRRIWCSLLWCVVKGGAEPPANGR